MLVRITLAESHCSVSVFPPSTLRAVRLSAISWNTTAPAPTSRNALSSSSAASLTFGHHAKGRWADHQPISRHLSSLLLAVLV